MTRASALALAAVALAAVPASAASTTIEAKDNVFAPTATSVKVGDKVTWRNTGQAPHEVTATDGSVASGNIDPGASYTWTATKAGSVSYYCRYHGTASTGMKASLTVQAASTAGSPTSHPTTGGGREVQIGLAVLMATAAVGVGLRGARGRAR